MTKLIICIEWDAHGDTEFMVEEENDSMGKCDNCNRPLTGARILGRFHDRKELMIYLTGKIEELM